MSEVPRAAASDPSASAGELLDSAPVLRWRSVCVAALVLAAHVPLAWIYLQRLIRLEHYEFAPLLLVAVTALLIRRGRTLKGIVDWNDRIPVLPSVIGLSLLATAVWLRSPWLGAVSFVITSGLYLKHFAGRYTRELLYAWAPLLLLIRPPFAVDVVLMQRLQLETSLLASSVLDGLGIPHLRNGNILQVPGRQFLVEEACSGIHSVFALLAAAAVYIAWVRVPAIRAALLLACAVIWACLANLVRIITIVVVHESWGVDLTEGLVHDVLGGVLFLFAAGMLVLSDRFLQFWLGPIQDDFPGASEVIQSHRLARSWNAVVQAPAPMVTDAASHTETPSPVREISEIGWWPAILLSGCAVAIAVWEIDALPPSYAADDPTNGPAPTLSLWLDSVGEDTLPDAVEDWQRVAYDVEPLWGDSQRAGQSKLWTYRTPHGPAVVSLDSPFDDWHDVTQCYLGTGAAVESYSTTRPQSARTEAPFTEVVLRYPSGIRALLLFINFDEAGRNLVNRSAWLHSEEPIRWLAESVVGRIAGNLPSDETPQQISQFQLLIEFEDIEPSPVLRADTREKFHVFSREIKHHLGTVP